MVLPSAYNPVIPQPNDELDQSQLDLLNNFGALFTYLQTNHGNFDAADAGKHKWVSFPQQGAVPATLNTEVTLYSAVSALTNNIELNLHRQNNGPVIQTTAALSAATGWTYLPSGILVKWGLQPLSGPGPVLVGFPQAPTIPNFANAYVVLATPVSSSAIIQTNITSNLTFVATLSVPTSFYYLAIGN